jgi:hypothetical protein
MPKPTRHHYVPQFYLRQFCCADDGNKVPAVSLCSPYVINKPKSINGIGYEDNLYSVSNNDIEWCIEEKLNKNIETPITQSDTWAKIKNACPELINDKDKLIIYLFMCHIEARNIERLEFIKSENKRIYNQKYSHDYNGSERDMHSYISSTKDGAERFFLEMSNDIDRYMLDYNKVSISILESNISIRTSTNPVVTLPESMTYQGESNTGVVAKWLPLSHRFGAMQIMCDSYCDFSASSILEENAIRALNRLYLVQMLNSKSVRHVIANDEFLAEDFKWAGMRVDPNNPRKYRIQ